MEGSLNCLLPRGIPSQLVAFSKTGSHLLFGVSSACVKLSAPRNRAQTGGLGFPRCAHDGLSPPHSASPPTRSSISPQLPTCRLTATQLTPEGPFSSQGLSALSPDVFILGASLCKVLCQHHLQATLPLLLHTHTHTPHSAILPVLPFINPLSI